MTKTSASASYVPPTPGRSAKPLSNVPLSPPSPGRTVSRAETARILGLSYTQVMRAERSGRLVPASVGRNGEVLYDLKYVERKHAERRKAREEKVLERETRVSMVRGVQGEHASLSARLDVDGPTASDLAQASGEFASRIFSSFKAGVEVVDVVILEKISPQAAARLYSDYLELTGAVTLTRAIVEDIGRLGLEGDWPLTSGEALLENLRAVAEARLPCARCKGKKKKPRQLCATCVSEVVEEAREAGSGD